VPDVHASHMLMEVPKLNEITFPAGRLRAGCCCCLSRLVLLDHPSCTDRNCPN